MRVIVVGGSGAIGRQLVPLLVAAGHEVAGTTRRPERVAEIEAAGATAMVTDVFDEGFGAALAGFRPDAVINQVTDLPQSAAELALKTEDQIRVRTLGYDAVVAAARAAGAVRYLAQSVAFDLEGDAGRAVLSLERGALEYPGIAIRYGYFYGPGTWYDGPAPEGKWVHIRHAAARTVELLTAEPGIYEVLDPA